MNKKMNKQKVQITLSETRDAELWVRHIISGIAFLPLFAWFLVSAIKVLMDPYNELPVFFYSPINVVFGILFIVTALYHGNFEVKYLIAEARQGDVKRLVYMMLSDFVCIITGLAGILSIVQLHFVSVF